MSELKPPAVPADERFGYLRQMVRTTSPLQPIHEEIARLLDAYDAVRLVPETAREIEAAARAVVQAYEDGYGTSTEIKELRRVLADP